MAGESGSRGGRGSRVAAPFLALGKGLYRLLFYGILGVVIAVLGGYIAWSARRGPDLQPWHTAPLREEFRVADADRVRTLDDYRALEERLFAALRREVYDRVPTEKRSRLDRYSAGSLADPGGGLDDGNRTWELPAPGGRAAALLLHGLTDSPYGLRRLGERLHAENVWVVGLRLPGHGTAPVALTRVQWQDWAAAMRLAARDLRAKAGADVPLFIVGFSTGAALTVEYSLARLEGEDLPEPAGIVLLSPAIGVDALAPVSTVQEWLSHLPGLGKLAWLDLVPEIDPYKYASFATNAGSQIYKVTKRIGERLERLGAGGPIRGFPRTLVFQSVADSTVSARAVVRAFLGHLAPEGHALVAFDVNRRAEASPLLKPGVRLPAEHLLTETGLPFDVTLLTNAGPDTQALVARRRAAGRTEVVDEPTGLEWPAGIFSLSHLALPVPPDDPVYGATRPEPLTRIYLGRVELLGENGLLAVPTTLLLRLRFNPFYGYVEARTLEFFSLRPAAPPVPVPDPASRPTSSSAGPTPTGSPSTRH